MKSKYKNPESVKNIAVIGGGVIGVGWASFFTAQNYSVKIFEPYEENFEYIIESFNRSLRFLFESGLSNIEKLPDPIISKDLKYVVKGADFIQECAPDKLSIKQNLFNNLDEAAEDYIPIATSTSSLLVTPLQKNCKSAKRYFTGHPYNPVTLIPLVEVSGGDLTDPYILEWAINFYKLSGKSPIKLKREISGHIAGRLSAALWQEAVHLLAEDIADAGTIDSAVVNGPGLRLATMGPHMIYHLAGGAGGIKHYLDHLGDSQKKRWLSLGKPELDDELRDKLIKGIENSSNGKDIQELESYRDKELIKILKSRLRNKI
tara:strand:- start:16011 stop:16964 length:954 start_codon:yes stop_codon:yes gene_type:complete